MLYDRDIKVIVWLEEEGNLYVIQRKRLPANVIYRQLFRINCQGTESTGKSWAKVFADEIFPAIDENRFCVLYSDTASGLNTPVNVIVGALIIKELFDYSDDEMVENLMLNFRLQYALHTTSFEEQPLSDKTLSCFRRRCYDYETLHNKDLYHDCVKDLSVSIAKLMGISGKVICMDYMMIEANIRRPSWMELIYTCISKHAVHVDKANVAGCLKALSGSE